MTERNSGFHSTAAMALGIALCSGIHAAHADTAAALSAIADTADRICGILATQGETSASKTTGDVHAELTGLARRLASVGVSASGDITSSAYQGILQQDLPATLRDIRECKLKVLDRLQATILPGTVASPGPGAPSPDLLQAPANATLLDTSKSVTQREEFGLYSCSNEPGQITCYVTVARMAPGQSDYTVEEMRPEQIKLVDNFHIEHHLRRAFFIDGLGTHHSTTNLSTGESLWLALEFEAGPRPISSARIVFAPYVGAGQLRGPVS